MKKNVMTDETAMVRYNFSDEELTAKAREIAEQISSAEDIEQEKKSVAADYVSKERHIQLVIRDLSRAIADGYDMRRVPCHCFKSYPSGWAYYYTHEQLADYAIDYMIDQNESVENLVNYLLDSSLKVEWVKKRAIRDDERQIEIPAEDEKDEIGPDLVQELPGDVEPDPDVWIRDDREVRKSLSAVMKKPPTLKTIKGWSYLQCKESCEWADAYSLSKVNRQVIVPDTPLFLDCLDI